MRFLSPSRPQLLLLNRQVRTVNHVNCATVSSHPIRPYYETRANYNGVLKQQKVRIEDLEERVSGAKSAYNEALKRLEEISEEIHRMRKEREGSARDDMSPGAQPIVSGGPSSAEEDPMDDVINRLNCSGINSPDEYRDFSQLSMKSSPVRQKRVGELDCPHMYKDFTSPTTTTKAMVSNDKQVREGY